MKTLKIFIALVVVAFIGGLLMRASPSKPLPWRGHQDTRVQAPNTVISVETSQAGKAAGEKSEATSADEVLKKYQVESLKRFVELDHAVLPTRAEREELQKLLSDTATLRHVFLALTDSKVNADELQNNQQMRILSIDYLTRAVKWKQNPAHEDVVQGLKNFIVLDNLGNIDQKTVQKSFAGDKVEAYLALRESAPAQAAQLRQGTDDSRLTRLVRFAENQYLSQHADARAQNKN